MVGDVGLGPTASSSQNQPSTIDLVPKIKMRRLIDLAPQKQGTRSVSRSFVVLSTTSNKFIQQHRITIAVCKLRTHPNLMYLLLINHFPIWICCHVPFMREWAFLPLTQAATQPIGISSLWSSLINLITIKPPIAKWRSNCAWLRQLESNQPIHGYEPQ